MNLPALVVSITVAVAALLGLAKVLFKKNPKAEAVIDEATNVVTDIESAAQKIEGK